MEVYWQIFDCPFQPRTGTYASYCCSLFHVKVPYLSNALIFSLPLQVYFAARLDIPHYQIAAEMLPEFLLKIASFLSDNKGRKDSLEVVHLDNLQNHALPELNVFNHLSGVIKSITNRLPLTELADEVHKAFKNDPNRGNKFIDVGFSSDINTKRGKLHGGVSVPQELVRSRETIFETAMLAMTEMCNLVCQPELKDKVFVDKERNALFSGSRIAGNRIEALRVALSNGKHLVRCHTDDKNDVLDGFRGVINYSVWRVIDGEWWRLSIIGYSRKSIAGFFRRRDLYEPLVERVALFYDGMPKGRKEITQDLLDFSQLPSDQVAKRLKPHANKCVYYSIYVNCLSRLTTKLGLSRWHLLALLTNTIVSETPDFFLEATKLILKKAGSSMDDEARYRSLGPIDLAFDFYELVFNEKERRRASNIPVLGQRHQPHYNRRQAKAVVERSIQNVFCLYRAFDHIDQRLGSDPHYYGKA